MNKLKRSRLWPAVVVLILVSMTSGCGSTDTPAPEPITPTPPPQATEPPTSPEPSVPPEVIEPAEPPELTTCPQDCAAYAEYLSSIEDQMEAERQSLGLAASPYQGLMYVPGQVIISGPPEAATRIDAIAAELNLEPVQDEPLELGDAWIARLYTISDGRAVEEMLCLISEQGTSDGVAGDPNYHLSPAGEWAAGASSWTQNGGWVGATPGGGQEAPDAAAFTDQWALGLESGIGLYNASGDRVPEADGAGIRIGIFDTSPFTPLVPYGQERPIGPEDLTAVTANDLAPAHQSLTLTVSHPPLIEAPTCPGPDRHDPGLDREEQNISSHGLFVAGLVHSVAPASEIHLVRVLEDDGCGTLFSIAQSIQGFMDQATQDLEEDEIQGVILNLSLGVHQPRDSERICLPSDVVFLERVLRWAASPTEEAEEDVIIVAAAGNDSYAEPAIAPRGMELPAAYDFVYGVSASNFGHERSCFANFQPGDRNVAAPGGDGAGDCDLPQCDADHPEECLVSLSYGSETGYVYWVGTSFAAPLVTGQIALNFGSQLLAPTCAWPGSDLPGIIYLPSPCPSPSP